MRLLLGDAQLDEGAEAGWERNGDPFTIVIDPGGCDI